MTPIELLLALQDLEIKVQVDGGELRLSGPVDKLPPELREEVEQQKADLIGFVQRATGSAKSSAAPRLQKVPRTGDLPLSFAQQRFWFLSQIEEDSAAFNMAQTYRLRGSVDVAALEWSFGEIIRRHETLRSTVDMVEGQPVQVIGDAPDFKLSVIDATAHEDPERETARLVREESGRSINLSTGPLYRFALIRLRADDHVLLLIMHHLVGDRTSFGVLHEELARLYEARTAGRPSPLEELRVQYTDYAHWQRAWYERESEKYLAYWRERLHSAPTLELATDRPRPPTQSFRGTNRPMAVDETITAALQDLSRSENCTIFMTVLAAFQLLLARYSGQEDIVVGTPIGNREDEDLEPLIGPFFNTLVLRTDLSGNPTFRELLGRVRETSLSAYQYQQMPFEQIVVELRPERDLSRNPIFQVMFNLLGDAQLPKIGDLEAEVIIPEQVTSLLDLSLWLVTSGGRLVGDFEYNQDLFDEATIERMDRQFARLLAEIAANPDRCIWDLPILSDEERARLLVDNNRTARDYAADRCYHQLFEEQVAKTPDRVAVVCGDEALTYTQLNDRANQVARHLRSLGARPDQLVGISVERSPDMLVGLLGILKSGAAYVPLDPAYPDDRLAFIIEDAGIELLVCQESLRSELPDALPKLVRLDADRDAIAAHSTDNLDAVARPNSLAYVIFTSGSTGRPKGVQIEHRALVNFLTAMADQPGLTADDVLVAVTTISFDIAGLELYLPLMCGARVVIARDTTAADGRQLAELLQSSGATVMQATPATWHLLLESAWAGNPALKVLCGGEALPRELAERLIPKCRELWNMYGPTETTIWSLVSRVESAAGQVPIGAPIANTRIYLLDAHRQLVPIGVPGELYLGGDGLARGYWNRPELTAEKFIDHPFASGERLYNTGDLACYRADGSLEFLGRVDHQVKVRGFRIELGEIEHVLAQNAAIKECAVVARSKGAGDAHLVAHVVFHPGASASVAELRDRLREKLPDYMVPPAFHVSDALPLTPNGKVDRVALAKTDAGGARSAAEFVPPNTPLEQLLAEVWREVLGVDRVGLRDNFFELGGHSLLAMKVVFEVERKTGQRLSPMDLLSADLEEFARACGTDGASTGVQIELAPRDQPLLPSSGQQRFWFLWQLEVDSAAYNVLLALRLHGALDVPTLKWSLNEIVRRHEALRTTFGELDGQIVLVIGEPGETELAETDASSATDPEERARELVIEAMREPFDLANGPVYRFALFRLGEGDHVLAVTTHHATMDEWSLGLLSRELGQLYGAKIAGVPPSLPELTVQYADYAHWQRQWYEQEGASALGYWKQQLENVPLLELATDRPRPPEQTFGGTIWGFELPRELTDAMKRLGREEGCTFFMSMLAAFQVLLARYSGQDDIVVGTPVANRRSAAIEPLIGLFLNTLVLRTDLGDEPTFRGALKRVREVALGAFRHQDMPFEQLVIELRPERDLSRNPLFQVLFQLNEPWSGLSMGDVAVDPFPMQAVSAKFDLTLSMSDAGDRVYAGFEYNQDLFDETTIEQMSRHFVRLLEEIAQDCDRSIWELGVLTDEERNRLLVDNNRTERDYVADRCYHQLFEEQVARTPDRVAATCGGESLTYSELNGRANQVAHHLQSLGAQPDQLVGISVERSLDMLIGLLGILKSGAAYVPLDPAYPDDRLAFIIEDAGIELLVTQESLRSELPETLPKLVRLDADRDAIGAQTSDNPTGRAGSDSLAYVIFTSGSTGRPKGVQIEHRALVNFLTTMADRPGLSADDVLVAVTTISFDIAGLELYLPLLVGAQVVIASDNVASDGRQLIELLASSSATVMQATPATWHLLLESGWNGDSKLKVLCGGEALPRELAERLVPKCDELWNMYGPTETTIWSLVSIVESGEGQVPIGAPIANTEIYLLDAHRQLVPVGVPGELYLGGDGLARGYWKRPDLTAEKFIDHPYRAGKRLYNTGDLARYRPDGTIEFLGRVDDQVKVRGFRIELGEIEHVLAQNDAIKECAVVAQTKRAGDAQLVAHVVFHPGASATVSELRKRLRDKLPDYMVPPAFVMPDELPRTPNGKIDRKALRKSDASTAQGAEKFVPPKTPTEVFIANVWKDVLGIERVGTADNFFELGGHSLLAMKVVFQVEKEIGERVLPMDLLMQNLGQFAEMCDRRRAQPEEAREERESGGVFGRLKRRLSRSAKR